MMKLNMRRSIAVVSSMAVLAANAFVLAPVQAQNKVSNEIAKHPTITGIAAGVATTKALEHKAAWNKAHGRKLNFAERHPRLTGVGVALVTRHEIKKHMHPHN
jgi:di/tricarboxylate transporter